MGAAAAVVVPAPVLLVRAAPRLALLAAAAALVTVSATGHPSGPGVTTLAVVLVLALGSRVRPHPVLAFAVTASAADVSAWLEARHVEQAVEPGTFVFATFGTALTVGLGTLLRRHREALAELAERNADLAARNAELDRLRRAEADRAVVDERARIARELHDVVAHEVAAIAVRAAASAHVHADRDDEAVQTLHWVAGAAGETLTALRRMLGLLRTGAPGDAPPPPALTSLEDLVAARRAGGQDVAVAVTGTPPALPADVQLAVHRVLQEALANADRHAPGARVDVRLDWRPGRLALSVGNALATAPVASGGTGHGLLGMRERVQLVGGRLRVGREQDRWCVAAEVPLAATTPVRVPEQASAATG